MFNNKYFTFFVIIVIVFFSACATSEPNFDAQIEKKEITALDLKDQKPLTEDDIKKIIKFLPETAKFSKYSPGINITNKKLAKKITNRF
jgi:hypothetical protein